MKLKLPIISSLAIAALWLSGCSTDEGFDPTDAPATYITFAQPTVSFGGVETQSRGTLINTIEDLTEFSVYGFCVPQKLGDINNLDYTKAADSWLSKSLYCKPNIFNGVKVEKDGVNWKYEAPVKKWTDFFDVANQYRASSAKYTFIACANGNFTMAAFSTVSAPELTFSMPFSGGTETNPVTCDYNVVKDAMIAYSYDHTPDRGKVPLTFQHILTGLRFRVANHSDEQLTIHSMTFSGQFFGKANFNFEEKNVDAYVDRVSNLYWGKFTLVSGNLLVPAVTTAHIIGTSDTNTDGLTLLLLPDPDVDPTNPDDNRNALGYSKMLTIDYSIGTVRQTVEQPISLSYIPAPGTRHTATLNFLGNNSFYLVMQPDGDIWQNGSDDDIVIN